MNKLHVALCLGQGVWCFVFQLNTSLRGSQHSTVSNQHISMRVAALWDADVVADQIPH